MRSFDRPLPSDGGVRSGKPSESSASESMKIRVFPERFEIYLGAQRLKMTLAQYHVLSVMAKRPGWVFTPQQIVEGVTSEGVEIEAHALKNHIYHLRNRMGAGGAMIETVRGVGYRLNTDAVSAPEE